MRLSDAAVIRPRVGVRETVCRRPAVVQHASSGESDSRFDVGVPVERTLVLDSRMINRQHPKPDPRKVRRKDGSEHLTGRSDSEST